MICAVSIGVWSQGWSKRIKWIPTHLVAYWRYRISPWMKHYINRQQQLCYFSYTTDVMFILLSPYWILGVICKQSGEYFKAPNNSYSTHEYHVSVTKTYYNSNSILEWSNWRITNYLSFSEIFTWIVSSKLSFFEQYPSQNSIYREWIESSKTQLCWRWSSIQLANKTNMLCSVDLALRIYTVMKLGYQFKNFLLLLCKV